MCGILGYKTPLDRHDLLIEEREFVSSLTKLNHRGPDTCGVHYDRRRGVAFGHTRLSIRDLSSFGHQPMKSSCGRYIIIYNGEVYSTEVLQKMLQGTDRKLSGSSDTEVILECMAEFGVKAVLPKLIGMFAFGFYDLKKNSLTLARDRLGIKPLYWGEINGVIGFASELKALRANKSWRPKLNRDALSSYMRHNYIQAPMSIYVGISKLAPGTCVEIDKDNNLKQFDYWSLRDVARNGIATRDHITKSDKVFIDDLEILIRDAVERRLIADVPVAALLSGGVDSSLVSSLMAQSAGKKINTFSLDFTSVDLMRLLMPVR